MRRELGGAQRGKCILKSGYSETLAQRALLQSAAVGLSSWIQTPSVKDSGSESCLV